MINRKTFQSGFTLIEILVVIGILSILLAIVLIAINPQQQFQQANNTQRSSDVSAILNAVSSYAAQNSGQLPVGASAQAIDATARTITDATAVTDKIDLCAALVPNYIADLPLDPTTGTKVGTGTCATATDYNTGYTIALGAGNRVTVSAPSAQGGEVISITR